MGKLALLSVTDKTGIVEFAKALIGLGWGIISTGGTARVLAEAGVPCVSVEDVTRFPEMLDGRVKTLHPKVFAGILADRAKPAHMSTIAEHHISPIDLVAVNLYDFAGKPDIEQIDIGGPSLLRAAAKNSASVAVVVDPLDYNGVICVLREHGAVHEEFREELTLKVFETTAQYDVMIAKWMRGQREKGEHFLHPAAGAAH